jgi:hypothetical protein
MDKMAGNDSQQKSTLQSHRQRTPDSENLNQDKVQNLTRLQTFGDDRKDPVEFSRMFDGKSYDTMGSHFQNGVGLASSNAPLSNWVLDRIN